MAYARYSESPPPYANGGPEQILNQSDKVSGNMVTYGAISF